MRNSLFIDRKSCIDEVRESLAVINTSASEVSAATHEARVLSTWAQASAACPKQMSFGPCAGVQTDGACEVEHVGRCSFLDVVRAQDWPYSPTHSTNGAASATWPALGAASASFAAAAQHRPVVIADLIAPPLDAEGLKRCAAALLGGPDACLIGDHGAARVQFPPSYRARLLTELGLAVWAGLNCRDRNRVALEGEIAACLDAGVTAIHCVTGDHTALGHRPDAPAVFDLDSVELTSLAAGRGVLCSVAHAPSAPPVEQRIPRLLRKVAAGADVVFVDHCGGVEPVAESVARLRGAGFAGIVLACVPLVTSASTAKVVQSFVGDRLPLGYLSGILSAQNTAAAGVAAATTLAGQMLAIPGVNGVNISGGADPGHEMQAARAAAEISRRVLGYNSARHAGS